MRERVKKLWLEALRSNKYKQTSGALCSVDEGSRKYCCLGVLCDIYSKEMKKQHKKAPKWVALENVSSLQFINVTEILPVEVEEWAGLDTNIGIYYHDEIEFSLAEDNDDGKSFKHIAKIIEENF